ncbi:MAG: hypothetical protein M0R74_10215 [Dehalococcoidia bacterium]|nr:hypothetical protein [Dehalococcoidia bacterium]
MNDDRPFLLVRARPLPEAAERFEHWFLAIHLPDVHHIPGIGEVRAGKTPAGTWLGLYSFTDTDAVQTVLSSPEAQYARGTWTQWAGSLDELQIEIFAPLGPLPVFQSRS